jgi:hypothetical protein
MKVSLDWLRDEAVAQGLNLSAGDLEAIPFRLEEVKSCLASARETDSWTLESPYRFVPNGT